MDQWPESIQSQLDRWTWKGTLTGAPFLGIEAKGQKIEFDAVDIWTVKNGQLHCQ